MNLSCNRDLVPTRVEARVSQGIAKIEYMVDLALQRRILPKLIGLVLYVRKVGARVKT